MISIKSQVFKLNLVQNRSYFNHQHRNHKKWIEIIYI
jgi:hypothetical protein